MTSDDKCYLPNVDEVASEVLEGEAVLINLSNGMYYSIDGVGGRIWELIERGAPLSEIVQDIAARFDVDEKTAGADLRTFMNELVAENLVVPAREPGDAIETTSGDERLSYTPPVLHIFRDMGDLLALDPPMPGLKDIPWKEEGTSE